mmetsp:Transcript_15549/g.42165  ORF Transcript_15549/g.42165 Transcript_15549/m.42165 type:complete len:313 (+) Transcript_15549:245-1183(+)
MLLVVVLLLLLLRLLLAMCQVLHLISLCCPRHHLWVAACLVPSISIRIWAAVRNGSCVPPPARHSCHKHTLQGFHLAGMVLRTGGAMAELAKLPVAPRIQPPICCDSCSVCGSYTDANHTRDRRTVQRGPKHHTLWDGAGVAVSMTQLAGQPTPPRVQRAIRSHSSSAAVAAGQPPHALSLGDPASKHTSRAGQALQATMPQVAIFAIAPSVQLPCTGYQSSMACATCRQHDVNGASVVDKLRDVCLLPFQHGVRRDAGSRIRVLSKARYVGVSQLRLSKRAPHIQVPDLPLAHQPAARVQGRRKVPPRRLA